MQITFIAPNNARTTVEAGPVATALGFLHPVGTLSHLGGIWWALKGPTGWSCIEDGDEQAWRIQAAYDRRCRLAAVRKAASGVNFALGGRAVAHMPF